MRRMSPTQVMTWIIERDPLAVTAFRDPIVEALGHPPTSAYVETYWLPVIGPSATWAMRKIVGWLEESPDGYPLALAPLARELGLGDGTGRGSHIARTIARLVTFDLAAIRRDELAIRLALPPLARRHLTRLPGHLVERHEVDLHSAARRARRQDPAGVPVR